MTIFRDYSSSDSLRSDRSAGDRTRHREKVREAIRDQIADILSEEAIIGRSADRVVKVPIRGIREYRFVHGENPSQDGKGKGDGQGQNGVGTGNGQTQPGQVIGKAGQNNQQPGPGQAGNDPGADYYETDVSIAELIDIMFEDLELPELEKKKYKNVLVETNRKRKGFRRAGIRVHLDKKRTAKARLRRKHAARRRGNLAPAELPPTGYEAPAAAESADDTEQRFPYRLDDLRYRRLAPEERPRSNAVVVCIMDTSGSMDTMKKYLARSFFFLLYQFVRTRYQSVEVVFVAHDTNAKEVSEEEFFSKGEAGGTCISAGYRKALEIIQDRYHPTLWNVYAFHCSDGDNFSHDNEEALAAGRELCELCNLFGYGEIKTHAAHPFATLYSSSMLEIFKRLEQSNFQALEIQGKDDIWPSFKKLLTRDREEAA